MLIGYLSDESYLAIADGLVEFRQGDAVLLARSMPSGAVYADLGPGLWSATLAAPGFGSKVTVVDPEAAPHQFRLLRDRLLGYAWPKAVRSGEKSELRISSPEPYWIRLVRHGRKRDEVEEAQFVETLAPGGDRQILPDGDLAASGLGWNHFGCARPPEAWRFRTAPDVSGLYFFHVTTASGLHFSFPWVVAPVRPTCDVAVLANDITWNAYNNFGGRSNYVAAGTLPATPAVNARQDSAYLRDTGARFWDREDYDPLSFDRPEERCQVGEHEEVTDPIWRPGTEHLAAGEWRMLGWLDREGFAYDLYSETQLHRGELDLDAYRVLVIHTHPEYWSAEMYWAVKRWVFERRGRLAYLGGNGIQCAVEFASGGAAMVVRNGDQSAWVAVRSFEDVPESVPPNRFARRVEGPDHLLGLHTTLTGMGTAAPYRVLDAGHWAFDGLGLDSDTTFGHASLSVRVPGGASGHETDKIGPSAPNGLQPIAKGTNPNNGGAEMVHFETASGGEVFAVGSITWPASLLVDPVVSQITRNVLERFTAP